MNKRVFINGLTTLPRGVIRVTLLCTDTFVVFASLMASLLLVLGGLSSVSNEFGTTIGLVAFIGPAVSYAFNLQRIKLVMFNAGDIARIGMASVTLALLLFVAGLMASVATPALLASVFCAFLFTGMIGARTLAISILGKFKERLADRQPVAIFGAGGSGIQLASALAQSATVRPVRFYDDNPTLQGMEIGGIQVVSTKNFIGHMREKGITKLFVALPESAGKRQREIVEKCQRADIEVQVLPTFVEMLTRSNTRPDTPIAPLEILGRDKVELEIPAITKSYAGRVVLVSGAGGSIGSELCRQLIDCKPQKIVLFEHNEYNLYKVCMDLEAQFKDASVDIKPVLGSVTDPIRVRQVLKAEAVDIVLHAAAYKHVPIVEDNELEGARNNVLGTKVLADAASDLGIERFILISTDKAVRPTNIMGATKRMAELVIQDLQTRSPKTNFSMVRFGNVLGSSGSMLPLFLSQIEAGGPVTVTHPEVCRYFMTVSEAARLVLLAGAYAEGGDVFLLDMGEPKLILDIARKLIELSGRSVKDPITGEGDIEIKVTGLRPGEKLIEELLIDHDNAVQTPHPKILRAQETSLSQIEVAGMLREIQNAVETSNPELLRTVVTERVDGYQQDIVSLNA